MHTMLINLLKFAKYYKQYLALVLKTLIHRSDHICQNAKFAKLLKNYSGPIGFFLETKFEGSSLSKHLD